MQRQRPTPSKEQPFDDIFSLARDMEMQAKGGSLENFDVYIHDLEGKVTALNPFVGG